MLDTKVLEQINDALTEAQAKCPNASIKAILDSFSEFIDLCGKQKEFKYQEFEKKLQESYRKLYQLAEKAAAEQGIDSDTFQQMIADPAQMLPGQFADCEFFKNLKQPK